MQKLQDFKEILPNSTRSIHDHIGKPTPYKEQVLQYMRSVKYKGICTTWVDDVLQPDTRIGTLTYFEDGAYSWRNDIVYYFEKYDLELPDGFIRQALERLK